MIFYAVAILVVLIDQITKGLVRVYLELDEQITLWGIELTHYENSGMAGSMFPGYARVFGIIAVLFIVIVLYNRRTGVLRGRMNDVGFGLLVGGAAGNGIDRLLHGQVTDFLISRSGNGILNLADHAIQAGVIIVLILAVYQWLRSRISRRCSI